MIVNCVYTEATKGANVKKLFSQKPIIIVGILFLIILAAVPSLYFYNQYQNLQKRLQNPQAAVTEETQQLVAKIGKLIELPSDEVPTIATISDKEKLRNQPFFDRAKNGDKLIIFTNAKKAILYDPVANKIIEVAPVNIGTGSATPSASLTPNQQSLKFVLYNGTAKTGLTLKYEEDLKKTIGNATVIDRANAKKNDYEKTILIDITGTKAKEIQQISRQLGISIGQLPEGETKPANTDFLIILGADKI